MATTQDERTAADQEALSRPYPRCGARPRESCIRPQGAELSSRTGSAGWQVFLDNQRWMSNAGGVNWYQDTFEEWEWEPPDDGCSCDLDEDVELDVLVPLPMPRRCPGPGLSWWISWN